MKYPFKAHGKADLALAAAITAFFVLVVPKALNRNKKELDHG